MQIYAIQYAESVLPQSRVFCGGAADIAVPISFMIYLVRIRQRLILIDAGCHTMPGFEMKHFCPPSAVLERMGIRKQQITDVIITHADHDHIQDVSDYPDATVYIQSDECGRGREYLKENRKIVCFDEQYTLCGQLHIRRIGGHARGSCIVELTGHEPVIVFVGDECYRRFCLEKKLLTGSSVDPARSEAFLQQYSREEYRCLLCHEPGVVSRADGWKQIL